jgi:hypothetical protein
MTSPRYPVACIQFRVTAGAPKILFFLQVAEHTKQAPNNLINYTPAKEKSVRKMFSLSYCRRDLG